MTFNGTGFDLPLLETRFVLARRRWPARCSTSTCCARRGGCGRAGFADCRLATLEREVLGLVRDDDVPGALIPSLYFDYLRSRRAAPLARVLAHNRDDVLSLVALLGWFGRALAARRGAAGRRSWPGSAVCGSRWMSSARVACYRAALAAGLDGALAQAVRAAPGAVGEARCALGGRVRAVGGGRARRRVRPPAVGGAGEVPRASPPRLRDGARRSSRTRSSWPRRPRAPLRTRSTPSRYRLGRLERRLSLASGRSSEQPE